MARGSVYQVTQIGPEVTAGTSVAASKRLTSLSIEPGPRIDVGMFRPTGNKFNTVFYGAKDWTEASVSGAATYTEVVYPLSSVLRKVTATGAGTEKTWLYDPSATAADTFQTYTVELGDGTIAEKFTYGTFTEFGFNFTRDSVEVSGNMIGQKFATGATLTGSPTTIALVPVLPTQANVYLDSTVGGIGTTKLTSVLRAEWRIANRFGPYWNIDSANESWKELVEIVPTFEGRLLLEANATTMGYLANLRAGDKRYLQIKATGAAVGAGNYTLQLDTHIAFSGISQPQDQDGVYAIEFTWTGTPESTWNGPTQVTVINDLSAL